MCILADEQSIHDHYFHSYLTIIMATIARYCDDDGVDDDNDCKIDKVANKCSHSRWKK